MVLFVTFTFTNTQRNETNLHWLLNPLESNASFLAEQSFKNLSSQIAAQLKAQLKIKTQTFLFRAITKSRIFARAVLPFSNLLELGWNRQVTRILLQQNQCEGIANLLELEEEVEALPACGDESGSSGDEG